LSSDYYNIKHIIQWCVSYDGVLFSPVLAYNCNCNKTDCLWTERLGFSTHKRQGFFSSSLCLEQLLGESQPTNQWGTRSLMPCN